MNLHLILKSGGISPKFLFKGILPFVALIALSSCSQDAQMKFYGPNKSKADVEKLPAVEEGDSTVAGDDSGDAGGGDAGSGDGSGSNSAPNATPTPNPPPSIELQGENGFSCGIEGNASRNVRCYGINGLGQLGNGTTTDTDIPFSNPTLVLRADNLPLTNIMSLKVSIDHSCALDLDNHLYCWGSNADQRISDLTVASFNYAKLVSNSVSHFWVPYNTTIFRLQNGTLVCRGTPSACNAGFEQVAEYLESENIQYALPEGQVSQTETSI